MSNRSWIKKLLEKIFWTRKLFIGDDLTVHIDPIHTSLAICLLKPGDFVIDVGGSVGHYTALFSQIVGENGRVITFEPSPLARRILIKSLQRTGLKNVSVYSEAVSDGTEKYSKIVYRILNEGSESTVVEKFQSKKRMGRLIASKKVTMTSIDQFIVRERMDHKKLRFLKIDAEGNEDRILKGASSVIQKNRPIILVEFGCDINFAPSYPNDLSNMGYKLIDLKSWQEISIPFVPDRPMLTDFLCIPKELWDPLTEELVNRFRKEGRQYKQFH